ncbi:MAG: efflux RND transporter periplasmic adaptor subunit [Bernardetiaceae bacterium]|jgi:RND family efflux transporter MFP subunit|nr:efflux RND transporter periplasmic adaptor subunit [Bernardetiaceae bacterium]
MKTTLRYLAYWKITLPFLALLALAWLLAGCHQNQAASQAKTTLADVAIPVKTVPVSRQTLVQPVVASGLLASETEARLSFKTGGIIQKIYVGEGDAVRKGQLLAVLNLTEINAQVTQAQEGLAKAERDYQRVKNLYADSVATLEQLQNTTTALNVAKQSVQIAQFNQGYSEIRAVASGRIVRKLMNEGELAASGAPVFFMNATGPASWVVKVGVADKDWVRLQLGDPATVGFDALPGQTFPAKVSSLAQGADPTSGLYQVELKLTGGAPQLATGFFATAQLTPSRRPQYVGVPVDALVEGNGDQAFVFVPVNGQAQQRPVKVAYLAQGQAMIYEGLTGDETVITDGSAYLTDKAKIMLAK